MDHCDKKDIITLTLFFLTLILSSPEWVTSINISVNKKIIYNPWVLQPQLHKMSEQAAKHCCFSFGIHEYNAFSGTKAIRLNILLSSLFKLDLQSEWQGKVTLGVLIMLWWKETWHMTNSSEAWRKKHRAAMDAWYLA